PVIRPVVEVAPIRQQSRTGRSEAKDGVLDDRLPRAHAFKETRKVIHRVAVAGRRRVGVLIRTRDLLFVLGILRAVLLQERFLSRLRESVDRVTWFFRALFLVYCQAARQRHHALTADEPEAGAFVGASREL